MTTASAGPTPQALTAKEARLLAELVRLIDARGYPPTMRELGRAAGIASTGSVSHILGRLTMKGHIVRDLNRPRAITIVQPPLPLDHRTKLVDAGVDALQRAGWTLDDATVAAELVVDALVDELGPNTDRKSTRWSEFVMHKYR